MKRFIRFIPIVVAVLIIASLTLQYTPKNVEMSERFRLALFTLCQKLGLDSSNAWWNTGTGIRKLGHVMEYSLLGLASGIAFFDSHRVVKGIVMSLAFCIAISVVDQVVKVFVPIRHFDVTDIPFDVIGSVAGIILMTGICGIFNRGA